MIRFSLIKFIRTAVAIACGLNLGTALAADPPGPGGIPDYFGNTPNWAFSPALPKFVDSLPGFCGVQTGTDLDGTNQLGQCMPVAKPDIVTYPGSDYYEIELRQYTEQMHSSLPATLLRGYRQTNNGTDTTVCGGNGQPACTLADNTIAPPSVPHYLGPVIIAQKDRPVRIKFTNNLPTGQQGNLFLPVDTSVMGAGAGPLGGFYTENRATIHLHGGKTPWISDGTPHQWITPAGETTIYKKGDSVRNVPDMPDPGEGSQTFYYTNQQSARLMFYHDHAYGITRLNVYAGEAAGYLITDPTEQDLVARGILPAEQIPLIIQDKSWVDASTITTSDPTWNWGATPGTANTGDLWWPHVYMPAQNPYDLGGVNPMGRWVYGPWFWPPTNNIQFPPVPNEYYDEINAPWEPPVRPGTPNPSWVAEAFMDTMVVNGTAFPSLEVEPKSYRFRVLNAAHDRFLNLQLYEAKPVISGFTVTSGGSGYTSAPNVTISNGGGTGATAEAVVDLTPGSPTIGQVTAVNILTVGSGYTSPPVVSFSGGGGNGAAANANVYSTLTEVGMVPASPGIGLPPGWPTDGREGGVPDPSSKGPDWIQIGTEGGFLPAPVVLPNQPINWNADVTTFNAGNVFQQNEGGGTLFLGPAERADVIVDFSNFAGKTLILYNDAPAPWPALDPHYDYYTGNPDRTDIGGHPGTQAGFGPNIRTVMQIKVAGSPAQAFDLPALESEFVSTATAPGVFARGQDPIIVGQSTYNSTYNTLFPTTWPNWGYVRIQDNAMSLRTVAGTTLTLPLEPKAIQDEMGEVFDEYGRMSAKLGLEMPKTNAGIQTFVVQNYVDPPTEIITDSMTPMSPVMGDGTQIWKITHNGVDTHPVHFHIFDVQLINRVGWDGAIRIPDPNELGWKDTIRISPLEDTIVALRPVAPKLPFGIPDSIRLLNPALPVGATEGFTNLDPVTGQPIIPPTTNLLYNFGWEYVWHCHILSHEENDMMRSIKLNVARSLPSAPTGLSAAVSNGAVNLSWNDPTPASSPTTLGNPANEIYFRVERASGAGAFAAIGNVMANQTSFVDNTPAILPTYRVIAVNAQGDSAPSNIASVQSTVSVTPGSASFGNVAVNFTTSPATFTVTNTGLSNLQLNSFTISGTNSSMFSMQNGTCGTLPTTLAPGGSCYVLVKFTPTTTGIKSANLQVTTDVLSPGLSLTGNGIAATNPVRRTSPTPTTSYSSVAAAIAAATGNATIQAWGVQLPATSVTVNSTGTVNLVGGFDATFSTNTGITDLQGAITVARGALVVNKISIR